MVSQKKKLTQPGRNGRARGNKDASFNRLRKKSSRHNSDEESWNNSVFLRCASGERRTSRMHIQQDVSTLLNEQWAGVVAFPPCTDLAVSGARWFAEKRVDGRQR